MILYVYGNHEHEAVPYSVLKREVRAWRKHTPGLTLAEALANAYDELIRYGGDYHIPEDDHARMAGAYRRSIG